MRFRVALAFSVLVGTLALFAVACGGGGGKKSADVGGGGSVPAGADYVVSTAIAFLSADTNFEGGQWSALDDLSGKFPDREKLLQMIRDELAKQGVAWSDVKAALGPETDVGVLNSDAGLFLTQSPNEAKLRALVAKVADDDSPPSLARVGDWTAASDKQSSVDTAARAHGGSSLLDSAALKEAMGDLPGDALARLWVAGKALSGIVPAPSTAGTSGATPTIPGLGKIAWLAAAVQAKEKGIRLAFSAKSTAPSGQGIAAYESELVDQVPAGVLAYLSFRDAAKLLRSAAKSYPEQVRELEAQLGVTVDELAPLLSKEGAIYARPGAPLPEVTLVLQVDDEAAALATADKLVPRLGDSIGATGPPTTTVVEGVTLKTIKGDDFSLVWGAFDGKLVISDSTSSVSGLQSGDKLKDDSLFEEARDEAEMPDATNGFLYLNLKDIVPLVRNFAAAASEQISEELFRNLEPLRSFLAFSTSEGGKTRGTGFLGLD